ncbi:hypothetical protein CALCODRAFT_461009 [Calocera cornea HHB12733]|uniref:Actin binding protein n=1 Tax=Calocera cornea HHB12733 TaxID=1353952 RepID=A0A165CKR2_9BASI|nr:hypothetical protein CALCODRAFT_461009 [Calocera cornea HHB12733]
MSLQLNLSSPEISDAYKEVLNGDPSTNWVLYTYEGRSNDLKVQDTGSGGLEELEDSFNDGRIQYAYVRVKDPNSGLTKFVQINWCGDGVPESRKGLFHTHSATLTEFLKVVHVQVAARSDADVDPEIIMKRVSDASGSKYSVHNEQAKAPEPIAPIRGSGYQPIGKVDIGELRKGAKPAEPIAPIKPAYQPVGRVDVNELRHGAKPEEPIAPVVGSGYTPVGRVDIDQLRKGARPEQAPAPVVGSGYQPVGRVDIGELRKGARPAEPIAPVVGSGYQPIGKVDIGELRKGAKPDEPIAPVGTVYTPPREELSNFRNLSNPPPPPAAPRPVPPVAASPSPPAAPRPAAGGFNPRPPVSSPSAPVAAPERTKPAEDDRIGPVGTAYTPVSLGAPKKLVNPFANRMQQEEKPPAVSPASTGPKKLTWSERQAAAKKQQEEEDAHTRNLAGQATSTAGRVAETAVAGAGFAFGAVKGATQALADAVTETVTSAPAAPPRPPLPVRQDTEEPKDEEWPEDEPAGPPIVTSAPAAPPPPPSALRPTVSAAAPETAAPPPPPPPPAPPSADELEEVTTQVATMQVAESHPPGPKAIVTFSYEAAEGNEIDLIEGETIYGVEQLDEGWWSATTADGKTGLFPANYVELLEDDGAEAAAPPPPPPPAPVAEPVHEEPAAPAPPPPPAAPRPTAAEPAKPFAIATYEYEAAEENEISFAEGQKIIDIEFVSEDWWSGQTEDGAQGLFPGKLKRAVVP